MFKFILRPIPVRLLSDKVERISKLSSKFSNTPRPPKDPPDEGYSPESVNHEDIDIADFVRPEAYRQFSAPDERLGPGAGKNKDYKNGQYFGYHRFSFVELQSQALELRNERRVSGGVQIVTDSDEQDECADITLDAMKAQEEECDLKLAVQEKDIQAAKLKKLCEALEKTQKEMAKLQMDNQTDEVDTKDCSKEAVKEVKRTVDKKVKEILINCKVQLTEALEKEAPKKDQILAECKEMIKEATEKAVLPGTKKDKSKEKTEASESKCDNLKESINKFIKRKQKEAGEGSKECEAANKKSEDAKMAEKCAKLNEKIEESGKGDEKKTDKKPPKCETDKDKK